MEVGTVLPPLGPREQRNEIGMMKIYRLRRGLAALKGSTAPKYCWGLRAWGRGLEGLGFRHLKAEPIEEAGCVWCWQSVDRIEWKALLMLPSAECRWGGDLGKSKALGSPALPGL